MNVDRQILLENKEKLPTQGNLPFVLNYNKILPSIKNVTDKYWHYLCITENV